MLWFQQFLKGIFGRNKLNRIRETYHANALDINALIPPVKSLRHIKLDRFFYNSRFYDKTFSSQKDFT
jgi:hypothetical protein